MLSVAVEAATRVLLLALFLPFSALDKMLNFAAARAQARESFASPALAALAIIAGACIEIGMSLAILSGIADRSAALVLAVYCIATALLWKRFWRAADFRLRGPSRGRDTFWDFLKNCALAGGFLMLAFGGSAAGVRAFWRQPFASSHPYALDAVQVPP